MIPGRTSTGPDERTLVEARASQLWRSLGLDPTALVGGDLRTSRGISARSCRDLRPEDRWVTSGTWQVPPGLLPAQVLVDRAAAAEEQLVALWRSTGSATRIVDAVDVVDGRPRGAHLRLFVSEDGSASVVVRVGPAAVATVAAPRAPYVADHP